MSCNLNVSMSKIFVSLSQSVSLDVIYLFLCSQTTKSEYLDDIIDVEQMFVRHCIELDCLLGTPTCHKHIIDKALICTGKEPEVISDSSDVMLDDELVHCCKIAPSVLFYCYCY